MSRAITESVWRNDKPVAPFIEVDAYRGKPIDIPLTEYLVQGARDMDLYADDATDEEKKEASDAAYANRQALIEEYGARRGWHCNFFNISRPEQGHISKSTYGDGFQYTSRPSYIGQDCFSYVMNNGFQNSEPGQIIINVRNYMEGRIIIEEDRSLRAPNQRAFRYVAQWYIPPEFGSFTHVTMTWFIHKPTRISKNGRIYVRKVKEILGSTRVTMNSLTSTGFQYVSKNYQWPFNGSMHVQKWPDPAFMGLLDEETGGPYVQPNGPYPVSVQISFQRQKVTSYWSSYRYWRRTRYRAHWEHTESIEVDVRSLYGNDWWRSGSIINTRDPSYVRVYPGTYVPVDLTIDTDEDTDE